MRGEPQKTDTLIAPPRVGTTYLVPSIEHEWAGRSFAWPVLTPLHTDPELGFDLPHWNIDARFITAEMEGHLTAQLGDAYSTEKPLSAPRSTLRRQWCSPTITEAFAAFLYGRLSHAAARLHRLLAFRNG